jgi:hypothetical protein
MGKIQKKGKEEFSSFIHSINQNWVSKALVAFSGIEEETLDEH